MMTLRAAILVLLVGALTTCAYQGSARDVTPELLHEPGWLALATMPVVLQEVEADSGAAALSMVLGYWKSPTELGEIVDAYPRLTSSGNMDAADLREYAERKGLLSFLFRGELQILEFELLQRRPIIVGLVKRFGLGKAIAHYEVVVAWHPERQVVVTLDPAHGLRQNTVEGFLAEWEPAERLTLVMFPR
jgi:ABC-type bacteriocin/lantibiotic exporter with double-glycine peptidase domain